MIVDASALLAFVRKESLSGICFQALADASRRRMSAANFLEAALVVDGLRDPAASEEFDELIRKVAVEIEPVTEMQARIARAAHRRFGRGSGHPAKLNFGDCFAYALAKERDEPLLFIGQDFIHTDVRLVLA